MRRITFFARKVLDATAAEQVYHPEKYQIMDTKSISLTFMWYAQPSNGKILYIFWVID